MQKWKKIMLIIAAIVAVALIIVGTIQSSMNHNTSEKDNRVTLERLDSISKRLSDIWLELEKIDAEIAEREYQKDNLISEQTKLNDEASVIYLSLVTPELVEPLESSEDECDWIGCEWNTEVEWEPGQLTESWDSQAMPELSWETSHDRFKQLCEKYWLDASLIREVENKYNLREWIVLAILIAETSGWTNKNSNYIWQDWCYNLGNVWNDDSGNRQCFNSKRESIEKVGETLNNVLLWSTQILWCLSYAGSCTRWEDKWHIYASSNWNWERTVLNVLNAIYEPELWQINPQKFNVRRVYTIYQ